MDRRELATRPLSSLLLRHGIAEPSAVEAGCDAPEQDKAPDLEIAALLHPAEGSHADEPGRGDCSWCGGATMSAPIPATSASPTGQTWAVAVDYDDGHRVAFGRDGVPRATLPDAVAASCAIPGFYRAVRIDGRRYVDGGVRSASNLDILRDESLDLVIAVNPMSSLESIAPRALADRIAVGARAMIGRRLGSEARRLRGAGTEVVLIQPTAADLTVMGPNPMDGRRRRAVMTTARRTMAEQLRDLRGRRSAQSAAGRRVRARPPARGPAVELAGLLRGRQVTLGHGARGIDRACQSRQLPGSQGLHLTTAPAEAVGERLSRVAIRLGVDVKLEVSRAVHMQACS